LVKKLINVQFLKLKGVLDDKRSQILHTSKEASKDERRQFWGGLLFSFWLGLFDQNLIGLYAQKVGIDSGSGKWVFRDDHSFNSLLHQKNNF
jgi:hypothetical protein